MLAVSSGTTNPIPKDEKQTGDGEVEVLLDSFSISIGAHDFPDFDHDDTSSLLDSIDFDDLFVGINDGDVLPDLEMDPEILADFSVTATATSTTEEEPEINNGTPVSVLEKFDDNTKNSKLDDDDDDDDNDDRDHDEEKLHHGAASRSSFAAHQEKEIMNRKRDYSAIINPTAAANGSDLMKEAGDDYDKTKKSSSSIQTKNSQGKRKVKVDWTPELHRRFVQAVEQLGVDKAVPSRILELMGIEGLTRHNVASHLQKYRSHRKHLLAREAEAASWSQRRQMYSSSGSGSGSGKRDHLNPWAAAAAAAAPTMGFPPPMTPMHPPPPPHFRPLHVWGHPTLDQSLMHVWPKHLPHSPTTPPPPPSSWPPPHAAVPSPPPSSDPSYWHHHHHHHPRNALTQGTPCFPQPIATTRYPAPPFSVIPPPHPMYKVDPSNNIGALDGRSSSHPSLDSYPSKESIDSAIGDVLAKPWLPLPLGLKPPSLDSVKVELHRQGIPKIPPSSSCV